MVVVKICFVTANYAPEALGGTEQVTAALLRELRRLGGDVAVLAGSDRPHDGRDVAIEVHDDVTVRRLRRLPAEFGHVLVHPRLLALVRRELAALAPDVVHVHAFASLGTGISAIARDLGARVVATCHDLWVTCARYFRVPAAGLVCPTGTGRGPCVPCLNELLHTDPAAIERGLAERDRLLRAELALAHAVTAPSATAAAFVRACLPYDPPIEVVPHGLLRPVPAAHRAPGWQPGEPLRIGTWGGVVPEKGGRELVLAVAGLPCELHVTGPAYDERYEAELRAAAAAQGTRLVRRGRFTADERHPARDLHLAVFPSRCQETYGLVVDEALAHGVPAVVSDQGALRERAGTGGVVVTPLDRLAATLRELVGSPARHAALRAAIPATLPTIAASAARHLELYRRLR